MSARARAWIKRVLFGCALGIGVTVLIAWYFAVVGASGSRGAVRSVGVVRDAERAAVVRVFEEPRGVGYRLRLAGGLPTGIVLGTRAMAGSTVIPRPHWLPTDFGSDDTLHEEHVGWPMLAMKSGYGTRSEPGAASREVRLPAMSFPTQSTTYILPLAPIWGGFIVNSLLFASVYIAISGGIEYARRKQVGRCPHCRYSLGGLPEGAVCPECGTPQVIAAGAAGAP